jgi:hypothetical protein
MNKVATKSTLLARTSQLEREQATCLLNLPECRPCACQPARAHGATAEDGEGRWKQRRSTAPATSACAAPGRVQSQARRRSTAAACASARSSRFAGRCQGCWRVEPLRTWLHCCLTPRSRGDPARRGALGPRRAVASSIVLRGPRAPHLTGRLSSNVRPQIGRAAAVRAVF